MTDVEIALSNAINTIALLQDQLAEARIEIAETRRKMEERIQQTVLQFNASNEELIAERQIGRNSLDALDAVMDWINKHPGQSLPPGLQAQAANALVRGKRKE